MGAGLARREVEKVNKGIRLFAGLTALLAMGSAQSQVGYECPDVTPERLTVPNNINPDTGHTFEVYKADGICWADAQEFVAGLDAQGGPTVFPYLATITSSSENNWIVEKLLTPALAGPTPLLLQRQVWIGGFRDAAATGGWRWENEEGPFSGVNGGTGYTNWASVEGEPNNNDSIENWVTLGRYQDNLYGWNDEGSAVGSIGGFIVEYDTPRTAAECTGGAASSEACTTINGQTLTFPPKTFEAGDTVQFTAYEFTDPRIGLDGRCTDRRHLTLFDDEAFGPDAELIIPEYLCGSPKFVVVKVNSEDLTILKGAVLVENEPETVLPDNLYKCSDPIFGNPIQDLAKYSPDPQFQDVVVWQSTDPTNMLEQQLGNGHLRRARRPRPRTVAAVHAPRSGVHPTSWSGCTSTSAVDSPMRTTRLGNYQQFVALSRYKLTLLRKSIADARSSGSLKPGGLDGDGCADRAGDLPARQRQSCRGPDPGQAVPLARQCRRLHSRLPARTTTAIT